MVRQRDRRRQLLAAAGALAFALASAVSVASFSGTDLAEAAANRARSLVDLMDQRSPGARTEGQLTKTKTKHQTLAEHAPAPEAERPPVNLAQLIAPPVPGVVPVDLGPPPELKFLDFPPPGVVFASPPGGGSVPPGGGGGGGGGCCGGGGGPPPDAPKPPPTPAVPEPGTWMTMLLGFGVIGWAMRRSGARTQAAPAPLI
jgi:PEP-CTERM motif